MARHGPSPSVLVKLLDPAQRLPVHLHPTRTFAAEHLGCPYGKTEAWIILETEPAGGDVFVGTNRSVAHHEWAALVEAQDTDAMLELLRPITVRSGDAVLVPAGTPHAIGPDLLVLELQEPTDLSILLEWRGFDIDGAADGPSVSDSTWRSVPSDRTHSATPSSSGSLLRRSRHRARRTDSVVSVMPDGADPYFRAWAVDSTTEVELPAGFGVLLVTRGGGSPRSPIGFDRHRTGRRPRHPGGGEPVQTRRSTDRIPVAATRSRRARTARVGHAVTVRSAPNPARRFLPRGSVGL